MKILMIVRSNCYTTPGGDTVQIDMTAKYLRNLGVLVDIVLADAKPVYTDYALIHFFNIIRPDDILPHINHSVPFVVSTIFVDYSEYERENRKGIAGTIFKILNPGHIEYIKAIARWIMNGDKIKSRYYLLNGHNKSIRRVASQAKVILPNSNSEYKRFAQYINRQSPFKKVVNAIDPSVFDKNVASNEQYRDHVLCVGRIEGRKNQLNLIKALAGTDINLTIIGKPSPNHIGYYNACKELASSVSNIHFIEHIKHEELVKIYKAAKVHILPSWFETTGLSSLEAGVMECNIVVTRKGDTEEYFKDMAFYCQPDDISSIKQSVLSAFNNAVDSRLSEYILDNYTWEMAAKQTFDAYNAVLNKTTGQFQKEFS
ncbi:glycosyltransferase family 4 protein [Dyadobacter diqingensis]|uniref:glycosyltransferase family 4 protein n=1 Tax=Dyadobacter diqingensis TaxID=2938121 RepID=UPI0020C196D8|nr:glycosyltransferase [Dyadobacter diqingensis]